MTGIMSLIRSTVLLCPLSLAISTATSRTACMSTLAHGARNANGSSRATKGLLGDVLVSGLSLKALNIESRVLKVPMRV